ncbi:glycosyltransferase [Pseudodesulfovibrio pelocollis]|uniref:glycosyltransferase n=1 Tax=Pseudodesulfovibrio pelocollis TaxID=3051432 RepID=UPI00255B0CF9|nr:glycosyltransferase [Pseudodesulfovibrio sp. SB368]
MARDGDILFSIITPTAGNRPRALRKAVESVERAARFAGLETGQVEMLIGFDGVRGECPASAYAVHGFNLPADRNGGNGIRALLTNLAQGDKLIYLDDDNVLKPLALRLYMKHFNTELIIGRIDTQLTLDAPQLPRPGGDVVRPGNVDPLCVCVSRRLVTARCGGWRYRDRHDADFMNILDWHVNAHSETVVEDVVGMFDAGRSLDASALSPRQAALLDRLAGARDCPASLPDTLCRLTGNQPRPATSATRA